MDIHRSLLVHFLYTQSRVLFKTRTIKRSNTFALGRIGHHDCLSESFQSTIQSLRTIPQHIRVSAVNAVSNGILETFCFLGVYDFGRHGLREKFYKPCAILIGRSLYYVYSALIHALFWLPLVFPQHTKSSAPPFHTHGLPLLTVTSIAWFTIYEVYDDVAFVCFLHMIIDGWAAWIIGLQAPWCQTKVKRYT